VTDAIAIAARAAARRLAAEYGSGLTADVEAALYARRTVERPAQYLDPVSLGSLIVAIATLAWTIYSDQRKTTSERSPSAITRHVRDAVREDSSASRQDTNRITEIVVTEIIRTVQGPAEHPSADS
jgi:hypothetical protein